MNKLLLTLVVGTFAVAAGAQTPAPSNQMKQDTVQQTTQAAQPTADMKAAEAQKNVTKSKKHAKAKKSKKEKQAMAHESTSTAANANTGAATAKQAEANAAASKADSATKKAPPKMGTPAADSAMQKAAKP
jgi:hypothetical protein